ncbi:ABC sugar (glycerol) transporter, ATPase subunit [Pseudooceanicola batsensis HTCC2597]|uniref:ABC sugar (Glycerol) transporter, ATPase subunit n=1 Tax=Pseudooceanicola batsensis (strain ATCC BAA-863 / DSM 15984 / KCTC 12145 / HTCC2597) TaxID=252305 RepID=A3TYT2_PSEBH|nr:ABC transporter ATP-binding protein [Pseudooceanicola batsensis]EAQ02750.1 ABC sugar (glycerol) transporter, ATPase subunit [Pseudooceanicola batsensis HTCC2597]
MTLELKGVSRSVGGRTHIHRTDLTLQKGTMNVLLGPTLAGKTTLMRLMAGLDQPSEGRVFWEGTDVTGIPVQERRVAMVYQQFINYPAMTVYDNIASPLRLMKVGKAETDRRVRETAELMKLTPMLERKPLELSGGQQQRCALARALVKNAGLVLLDEPLANLDYKLREELRIEIPRIFEASGAIFVYATTEPEEALLLGGHTATLWEGRITQFGPTAQVYRQPADRTTARVFSDPPMNFIGLEKTGHRLSFGNATNAPAGGRLVELPDGRYVAGFRPNHVGMAGRDTGEAIVFDCTLTGIEITGSETFLHLTHGGETWVGLVEGVHAPEVGAPIRISVDPAHVYLFTEDGRLAAPASYAAAA